MAIISKNTTLIPFDNSVPLESESLFNLTPEQMLYVRYRSRGHSLNKAARAVGISIFKAHEWETSPWFGSQVHALIEELFADRKDALEPLVMEALEVVEAALHDGELKERLVAAQYVLNQYYGKPPSRTEFGNKPIQIVLQSGIPRPEE